MKIVIPDDYQDMVDQLAVLLADPPSRREALSRAGAGSRSAGRSAEGRRRGGVDPRAGRVLACAVGAAAEAQADRAGRPQLAHARLRRRHRPRHPGLDRREQLAGGAGRTDAGADRCLAPQRRARGRADAARRMAVHAVASPSRLDARHLRARPYRRAGGRGRQGARHEGAGLGPEELAGEGRRRGLRGGEEQGRSVRALRRAVDQRAAPPRDARHRRRRRSGADEADGAVRQRRARRAGGARCAARTR